MKTIIILLAVSFVTVLGEFTEEEHATMEQYKNECMAKYNIDESTFEKMKNREADENDENINCFFDCLLKKFGIITEDGNLNPETVREKMSRHEVSQEKIEEKINKCRQIEGTGCEKSRKIFKCLWHGHHSHHKQ